MSLLGYLVPRIASNGEEPAATQALAYLLNASPEIASARDKTPDSRQTCAIRPVTGPSFCSVFGRNRALNWVFFHPLRSIPLGILS